MAIHFISGKPGSGKSLYGVHLLIKEIVEGFRNVVTNLPLHPGRLNEYLQQAYPSRDLRLLQRLTVLTEEQARQFWKFRGEQETPVGVMYQLDELHLFFNARDWMHTGRDCLHYLSQHRKLGDVVIAITQSVHNVDKQFRSVAEDFTVLRNEYMAKYGPFRGRGRFVRKSFLSEPTGGGNQEPFETAAFTLDAKGIASCYDTAQGIGIHGSAADKGSRAKGWSIWWTIPLGLGLASLCGFIPFLLGRGAQKIIAPPAIATSKVPNGLNKPVAAALPRENVSSVRDTSVLHGNTPAVSITPERVWVTGYALKGRSITVNLSDGRVITEDDREIVRVTRTHVYLKTGEKLSMRPPDNQRGAGASPVRAEPVEREQPPSATASNSRSGSSSTLSASSDGQKQPTSSGEGQGSWVTDKYGVQRLRESEHLSRAMNADNPTSNKNPVRSRTGS